MRIKSIIINNFRGYDQKTKIGISDFVALVGRNDIGKSTILEALDIFFNEGKGAISIDKNDVNKRNSITYRQKLFLMTLMKPP